MRPISQTGFHRIPRNPKQRNFEEGGRKVSGTVLDTANERLAEDKKPRFLHPTKGFRRVNPVRTAAGVLTGQIKGGLLPLSMKMMREEIRLARKVSAP